MSLDLIGKDVLGYIFSYIPYEKKNWLHVLLVNKQFFAVGKKTFDPSINNNSALKWAISKGYTEIAKELVRDSRVYPGDYEWNPLNWATECGNVDLIRYLLRDIKVQPIKPKHKEFWYAVRMGHTDAINEVIRDDRLSKGDRDQLIEKVIELSSDSQRYEVILKVTDLMARKHIPSMARAVGDAIDRGCIKFALDVLDIEMFNVPLVRTAALYASAKDKSSALSDLLERPNNGYDPYMLNHTLILACMYGSYSVVCMLLEMEAVNPAKSSNNALRIAAKFGHQAVVERLLRDSRCDPSAKGNEAIKIASENGHDTVVATLIKDSRVDPTVDDNYCLFRACEERKYLVVEVLLSDPRVDPSTRNNFCISEMAYLYCATIFETIFKDPRVDPGANNNLALIMAVKGGRYANVKMLLNSPKVDPHSRDNRAITHACSYKLTEIVILFAECPRFDITVCDNMVPKYFERMWHLRILDKLLAEHKIDAGILNKGTVDCIRWCRDYNDGVFLTKESIENRKRQRDQPIARPGNTVLDDDTLPGVHVIKKRRFERE